MATGVHAVPVLASSPAAVAFGDGRRAESVTQVSITDFEGPLGLLLALIEARQVDVLTVPLGGLAEAYLDALGGLAGDRMGNISSFIAVAGQLILIKSRALLPRQPVADPTTLAEEGLDPEAELRARLILYRAFRDAGTVLLADAQARGGLYRREPAAAHAAGIAGARPPAAEPLDVVLLVDALGGLARVAPPPSLPPETLPRTVTLTERASVIREAIRGAGVVVLQDLLGGIRDRVVIAVTFLAMLELMKRREIVVEQAEPWGPIRARRMTAQERLDAGLPATADEAPLDESMESFA
jgi:segregation and condensation protein A